MSKLLANQIANYNDNGPVEVKEGINFPTGKPLQANGSSGTAGQYLVSTGNSIAWQALPAIPAAQVNVDWNSTSGVTQILNKPILSSVAISGSYNDLINKPTIPAAQQQSDWTASSGVTFIKNKPSLSPVATSGLYSDLVGRPSIPVALSDFGVGSQNVDFGAYRITYSNVFAQLSDLQAINANTYKGMVGTVTATGSAYFAHNGQWVRLANASELVGGGGAAITYSQSVVTSGSNVSLRLSGSDSTTDDILVTAGSNVSFTAVNANGFTINSTASGATNLDALTDVVITTPSNGQVLKYNGTQWVNGTDATSGGGTGLQSRTTANATTASIAGLASDNISITAAKTYALLKIQTSVSAWVTLYTDAASRTADASRTRFTDPAPGSGVIAEVVTTGSNAQLLTPAVYGFNNDSTPSSTVYLKVVNDSGLTSAITVTLTYVPLEA
jgi:hypothetical protein